MNLLSSVNLITIAFACLFFIPIIAGIIRPFSSGRVERSITSLTDNLAFLISIILSVYFTRLILSDDQNFFLRALYHIFPSLQSIISGKSIWVYIIFILIFLLIIDGILHLITLPIYRHAIVPMSRKISSGVNAMNSFSRRMIGGLWQLPKSIWIVLVFSLLLNLFTGFYGDPALARYADQSIPYRLIEENVVQPLLNTNVVKNIQVILNDSFTAAQNEPPGQTGKIQLIKYFNGVTLDQAVKSDAEIDTTAQNVVGSEKDDKEKAYLLYKWISKNIKYDDVKAVTIAKNPSGVSSGAIVAFHARTGVCFDYATLYVAMCRAVGLKVRFITGLGYSGTEWGDHAWNQVYDSNEDIWVDVDTTFGSSGMNYFDRLNFNLDHAKAQMQEEWQ